MGRKRNSSAGVVGFGALLLVGVVIAYWQAVLAVLVLGLVFYGIAKQLGEAFNATSPSQTTDLKVAKEDVAAAVRFEVSTRPAYRRRNVTESIQFYDAPTSIAIGGQSLSAYLLYVGQSEQDYPHLIDPEMAVGRSDPAFKALMGYWPSYGSISDDNRATYLAWLADGRRNPEADMGLVFLYFYGLEFRAIEEGKNHKEILLELVRLYRIYAEKSGSFAGYCSSFISWLCGTNKSWAGEDLTEVLALSKADPRMSRALGSIEASSMPSKDRNSFLISYAQTALQLRIPPRMKAISKEFNQLFLDKTGSIQVSDSDLMPDGAREVFYRTATSLRLNATLLVTSLKLPSKVERSITNAWEACEMELSSYAKLSREESKLQGLFAMNSTTNRKALEEFLGFRGEKLCKVEDIIDLVDFKNGEPREGLVFLWGTGNEARRK